MVSRVRTPLERADDQGAMRLVTSPLHTVHALDVTIPKGRLTAVTGMSGSGKTTLVLDSLVPALRATAENSRLPNHVVSLDAAGVSRVDVVDAAPIGVNVRSTVATYSGVLDELRRAYAASGAAKDRGLTAADFSYNTGSLRCPRCEGSGQVVLDVQFLPDVDIPCPDCGGSRYSPSTHDLLLDTEDGTYSLPGLLALTARQARQALDALPKVRRKLQTLIDLGLGYLTLGEDTPALSGGEAQRLKLATELGREQSSTLFVLDEPSVGLHPLDTRVLIGVLNRLLAKGATIVLIEHDLDLIANADHAQRAGDRHPGRTCTSTCPAGRQPEYFPPQLVRQANTLLRTKVMFGSNFPVLTPERWLRDFADLELDGDVRRLILKGSAARIPGLSVCSMGKQW